MHQSLKIAFVSFIFFINISPMASAAELGTLGQKRRSPLAEVRLNARAEVKIPVLELATKKHTPLHVPPLARQQIPSQALAHIKKRAEEKNKENMNRKILLAAKNKLQKIEKAESTIDILLQQPEIPDVVIAEVLKIQRKMERRKAAALAEIAELEA